MNPDISPPPKPEKADEPNIGLDNDKSPTSDDVERDEADEVRRSVQAYSPEEAKRILRKVDYRLIPLLTLLYLLAFIDRGNSTYRSQLSSYSLYMGC